MARALLHHAALPHRGGAVRVARLLASSQRAAGLDARLSFEFAESDPEPGDTGPPLLGPTPPEELGARFAGLPADSVLHLHTSSAWPALLAGLPAGLSPRAAGRRVLLTLHDAGPLTGGCAYPLHCPHFPACVDPCPHGFAQARARQAETADLLRRLAPLVVSPSRWLAGLARQTLPELPARIIPNGVPWPEAASLLPRARAKALAGVPANAPVALFAAHGGALAAYKAGPQWRKLWGRLRARLPQALGFAVGGDELAREDGLTTWPYVDRAKLALLMRAADVLLYPTLADNHPLVLLEAAAQELPVVGFDVGGVPEIVLPGETGLLAPPGDGEGFLAAALSVLADPSLRRRLGQAARAHGARRFHAARMAADYAALLD